MSRGGERANTSAVELHTADHPKNSQKPPPFSPHAPAHLSSKAKAWWASVVQDYDMEPHHLHLLQAACEAWDRCQQAREAVAADGLTFKDSKGNLKAHPAVAIERDARTLFARLVRELDLDTGAPAERGRPPALVSNRRG